LEKFPELRKEELIDLINKMLCIDPVQRLDIKQVMAHPWFSAGVTEIH
jgi:serine/threonine protein kinase